MTRAAARAVADGEVGGGEWIRYLTPNPSPEIKSVISEEGRGRSPSPDDVPKSMAQHSQRKVVRRGGRGVRNVLRHALLQMARLAGENG